MPVTVLTTDKRPVRYEAKSRTIVEHIDARREFPDPKAYTGEVAVFVSDENDWNRYYAEIFRRWDGEFQVEIQGNGKVLGKVMRFDNYNQAFAYLKSRFEP